MTIHLTNGTEDFAERSVKDVDELDELNRRAFEATDGNIYWYAVNGLPRVGAK